MIIDQRTKQILSTMIVSGSTTTITEQLDRKEYVTTNEILETLGGKWSRKEKCHVWSGDPSEALKIYINGGETQTITTTIETQKEKKKKFQFFGTPADLADLVVENALIHEGDRILEPSAGQGSLIKAVARRCNLYHIDPITVDAYELMPENRIVLKGVENANIIGEDFLKAEPNPIYDCIIMNPPFSRNQDIEHIRHAWEFVKKGGRLVAIASRHGTFASDKKSVAFREWLNSIDASQEKIDSGAFKESGTMTSSMLLVIDR